MNIARRFVRIFHGRAPYAILGLFLCAATPAMKGGDEPTPVRPVWAGSLQVAEPVLFRESAEGASLSGTLLFHPESVLRVYKADSSEEYSPEDFAIEGRKLVYKGGKSIPFLSDAALVSTENTGNTTQPHADGRHFLLYSGDSSFFSDHQLRIDYTTKEEWGTGLPSDQSGNLPELKRRLEAGEDLVVAVLGDSISEGCDATGRIGAPPNLPPYTKRFCRAVQDISKGEVTLKNLSKGGMTSSWGISQIEAAAKLKPALLVVAFGMNDSSAKVPPENFIANIKNIIAGVSERSPSTEFAVVSGITPNPDWAASHPEFLQSYHDQLSQIAGKGVVFCDVRTPWFYIAGRKEYLSLSGNGINHPNDYGHRLYADVLTSAILGSARNETGK